MDGESCVKKAYEFILDGDFEGAIGWFEMAIAADPGNASYHYKCSISCARSGKWDKALECVLKAVELDPGQEEYEYHLRTVQAKLLVIDFKAMTIGGSVEPPSAIEMLRRAVELDPLCFEAYYQLASAYLRMNRFDEAVEYAREALRLEPQHAETVKLLAKARRKQRLRKIRISRQN
ncbi:tetratricopeptide repeat protein [Paenibacillus beijingensis]|uniref:Uncharacterized protein n=1 Tax=Paenibacillus beijingensis TaxID=1126833 RepID=A0A0D5NQ95_9BACL|nr:tetratricopeptide repeat protein [Paenibacillus beijingensis]AJY77142.1 hypothetical protein VN24_24590 [Paenibacillus beijingensis]